MKQVFSFKRFLLVIIFFAATQIYVNGQVTPPAAYPAGMPVSSIKTWDATAPETNPNNLLTRPLKDVKQVAQYFDGLGRPLQTVVKQGSLETSTGANADIVSPVVYDAFGREQYKYLPFASTATDGTQNNGLFKGNPFQQQADFMTAQYGTQGETFFYGQTKFEASPLNRVQESFAPGNSWSGTSENPVEDNRRSVKAKYWTNTLTDDVKKWTVTDVMNSWGTYNMTGVYSTGDLYKNVTVDEHGKQVIEFKDKEGKVILKKVQLTAAADAGAGSGYPGWLSTYYIYDDLNNLRCVIQPKGVEVLSLNGWVIDYSPPTGGLVNEQLFRYEYDARNRMIKKKVPGAGEVWMVYDARDRVVLTQDANMRILQKWMYTTYDNLNRPVSTGLITDATNYNNHSFHLTAAYNSTAYPNLAVTYPGYEELTVTFYDNYTWRSSYANPLTAIYDITYNTYFQTASNTIWPYPQANTQTAQLKGMPTGTRIKVLGTSTYLYTVPFYDEKGRIIQVQSTNITGGTDIATTQYTWTGQPLVTIQKQDKQGTGAQATILVSQMTYDDLGRLVKTEKKQSNTMVATNAMSSYKTIAQNEYDKLGQLKKKKLAPAYNSNAGLENLNYDYNIRGWMLGVNRDYIKDIGTYYFGFELGYDKQIESASFLAPLQGMGAPAQYNGNIEGMVWKSKGDGEKRKYDFTYDAANRLMKADFTQYTGGTFNQTAGVNYNMKMGDGINVSTAYDANGNILQMQQWGLKLTASQQVDNLSYLYQTNSNKLARVTDANNDAATKLGDFKDGANIGTDDYTYDVNGNLNLDNNKAISSITYNDLNLPSIITVTGKGTIAYTYDAAGNKIKKVTTEGVKVTTTLYLGGSVYQNDTLQFISHEEGRIRFKPITGTVPASLQYDYMLKDHLGNVRMVLTEEVQQDIYPAATLENVTFNGGTAITNENPYYNIDNTKIVTQATATGIPVYQNNNGITNNNPYSNTAANSARLYQLNAATNTVPDRTGLGIVLKVMAGDNLNIFGKSYHTMPAGGYTLAPNPLVVLDLMNLFAGTSLVSSKGITGSQISTQPGFPASVTTLLNNQPAQNTNMPRAGINWIILDDQFKYVSGGFDMVGTAVNATGTYKNHTPGTINIPKNGYIYVYCSNESQYNVFFDNLQVVHNRGPILEETHYSPFGLTMAGISSKSAGGLENKKKYNGIEFENDLELNIYDAELRELDPQIGSWWEIDPKIDEMYQWSTYASNFDNPIRYEDHKGDMPDCCGGILQGAKDWLVNQSIAGLVTNTYNTVKAAISGDKQATLSLISYSASKTTEGVNVFKNGTSDQKQAFVTGTFLDVGTALVLPKLSTGKSSGTTLYRAVSEAEKVDMGKNGVRNTSTGYETSKLFATTAADASQFGKNNFKLDGVPNTVVKVNVPNSVMKGATHFEADGMKAVSIPAAQLPKVQYMAPLPASPKPTNPFGMPSW
jgi:RHS repeat-associated protein